MQIIAKTVLTVLGIHVVLTLYHLYLARYMGSVGELPVLLAQMVSCVSFTALVAFVAYLMVFNNGILALKMAGPGQHIDKRAQMTWLTKSLRVGLVFAGLMLLPGFMPKGYSPDDSLIVTMFICAKAVLPLYLVCGAPHFVRWQTRRSLRRIAYIEQAETPDFTITGPERTPNE
jgi:hypothetical protein